MCRVFYVMSNSLVYTKMSKPCLAFWRTNLSVYYTCFQTPEPDEIKKEKSPNPIVTLHMKFNDKFKLLPTEDETFYG